MGLLLGLVPVLYCPSAASELRSDSLDFGVLIRFKFFSLDGLEQERTGNGGGGRANGSGGNLKGSAGGSGSSGARRSGKSSLNAKKVTFSSEPKNLQISIKNEYGRGGGSGNGNAIYGPGAVNGSGGRSGSRGRASQSQTLGSSSGFQSSRRAWNGSLSGSRSSFGGGNGGSSGASLYTQPARTIVKNEAGGGGGGARAGAGGASSRRNNYGRFSPKETGSSYSNAADRMVSWSGTSLPDFVGTCV